jgi:chromate transporter
MRFPPSVVIIGVTALLVGVLQWPLLPVAFAIAPISVAMAWRRS